jgi:hypothetical protein
MEIKKQRNKRGDQSKPDSRKQNSRDRRMVHTEICAVKNVDGRV